MQCPRAVRLLNPSGWTPQSINSCTARWLAAADAGTRSGRRPDDRTTKTTTADIKIAIASSIHRETIADIAGEQTPFAQLTRVTRIASSEYSVAVPTRASQFGSPATPRLCPFRAKCSKTGRRRRSPTRLPATDVGIVRLAVLRECRLPHAAGLVRVPLRREPPRYEVRRRRGRHLEVITAAQRTHPHRHCELVRLLPHRS